MQWAGMYNFASSGTEVITGNANESQPSYTDLISNNSKVPYWNTNIINNPVNNARALISGNPKSHLSPTVAGIIIVYTSI